MNAKQERIKPTTKEGSDPIKRLFILFLISLFLLLPTSYATNQPYNITVSKKYVKATAKSTSSHGVWHYHTATFKNYCPQCHHYGTLSYSKYCDGGQWTCSHCDCDFDMQTGWEKITGTSLRLKHYSTIRKNLTVQNSTPNNSTCSKEAQVQLTPLEIVKSKLHLNMLLN